MQNIHSGMLLASSCPLCCSRLVSGETIVGGIVQCPKCKNFWIVDMDASAYELTIKLSPATCKTSKRQ